MRRLGLLLLLAAQFAEGQNRRRAAPQPNVPPETQPEYNGPKGSISGAVIDAASNSPIRKAQVRLSNRGGDVIVTDASGSFTFEQVPPGDYTVNARHPDYPPALGTPSGQAPVKLAPGERRSGVEIKLTPAATLSGRVTEDDGDPMPNCHLNLLMRSGENLAPLNGAATNRNGDYTFRGVPPGKLYLEVNCPAPFLQPRPYARPDAVLPGPRLGYRIQFYPNSPSLSSAQKLRVLPGQELRGLDFRMIPETISALTVHLAGLPKGETRSNRTTASLTPDDGSPPRIMDSRTLNGQIRAGEARFPAVPLGKYIVRILAFSANQPGNQMILAKQPVEIGDEPRDVTVQVAEPMPLAGMVRWEKADTASPQNRLMLTEQGELGVHLQTEVAEDGSFRFPAVTPGHYRVTGTGTGWVQSITVGGESFDGPEFDLKAGGGSLEINMTVNRGTVSGDVDVGPAHPAKIRILALFAGQGFGSVQSDLGEATAGQPPHFSVTFPPGHYRFYAVEAASGADVFRLLNDDALAARGETVDIRAGSETATKLRLITAEEIEKADP